MHATLRTAALAPANSNNRDIRKNRVDPKEEQSSSQREVRLSSVTTVPSPKPELKQSYSRELTSASKALPAAPPQHFPAERATSEPPLMPAPATAVAPKPFSPNGGAAAGAGSGKREGGNKKRRDIQNQKHEKHTKCLRVLLLNLLIMLDCFVFDYYYSK